MTSLHIFIWVGQANLYQNISFTNDGQDVLQADRKTAVQKKIILERMLGLIAQFAPLYFVMKSSSAARVYDGFGKELESNIIFPNLKSIFWVYSLY